MDGATVVVVTGAVVDVVEEGGAVVEVVEVVDDRVVVVLELPVVFLRAAEASWG